MLMAVLILVMSIPAGMCVGFQFIETFRTENWSIEKRDHALFALAVGCVPPVAAMLATLLLLRKL